MSPAVMLEEALSIPAGSAWVVDRAHGRLCTGAAVLLAPSAAWLDGQGVVACCEAIGGRAANASVCLTLAGRAVLSNCAAPTEPLLVSLSVSRVTPGPVMLVLAGCLAAGGAAALCGAVAAQLLTPLATRKGSSGRPSVKAVVLCSLALAVVLCWALFFFAQETGPWAALVALAACTAGAWPALVCLYASGHRSAAVAVFAWSAGLHVAQTAGAAVPGLFAAAAVAAGLTQLGFVGVLLQGQPLWLLAASGGAAGTALLVKVNLSLWAPLASPLYRAIAALACEHVLLLVLLVPRILQNLWKLGKAAPAAAQVPVAL